MENDYKQEVNMLQSQLSESKESIDVARKLQQDIENECNYLKN